MLVKNESYSEGIVTCAACNEGNMYCLMRWVKRPDDELAHLECFNKGKEQAYCTC